MSKNSPIFAWFVLFILLSHISACAIFRDKPSADIFYPPAPLLPRIQYLTSYSNPNDLYISDSSLTQFILGEDTGEQSIVNKPYGVAIHDGVIYVVDIRGPGYAKFDIKNKKFNFIYGSLSGKMKKPINIAIDKNGNIYIADIEREHVLVFDSNDEYIRSYIDTEVFKPSDVEVTDDKVFVSCMEHHQIHVFDKSSGERLYSIGKAGSKESELFYPSNITIGSDNNLYVSETGNFRVQVFSQNGSYLRHFGQVGTGFGQFARPKGVAVDHEGRIYVVDAAFENVQILDKDGTVLLFFGEPGDQRGNINLPAAIVIDYDNVAYFKKYANPEFNIEYLILVASQFGKNKINVYGYGKIRDVDYSVVLPGNEKQ